jgi:hypothetical protein
MLYAATSPSMLDIIFFVGTLAFFLIAVGYVEGCQNL